jgi:hypothetical protein
MSPLSGDSIRLSEWRATAAMIDGTWRWIFHLRLWRSDRNKIRPKARTSARLNLCACRICNTTNSSLVLCDGVSWWRAPNLELMTRFLFAVWQLRFLDAEHPPWRENGSVIYLYSCSWALAEQSLPTSRPHFTVSFETPPTWRARVTGFPFRRLLRLAGLRWNCSNPPSHSRIVVLTSLVL